jgi:hypothetical protein
MSCECESWAEHLFEPEEALTDAEREGLATHLALCGCCAIERELFLESWSALDDVEEELEPCPLLRARVWEKIREEECCPKPLLPELVSSSEGRSWRGYMVKGAAAAAAILLGFGVGRVLRPQVPEGASGSASVMASAPDRTEEFLDPELIELASQDGFSMELFPESTQFTPIDREMMTALAPSEESRAWLAVDRGEVVPLQYISQGLPQRGRKRH